MKNLAKTKYLLTIVALTIVLFVSVGLSFAWLANREKNVDVKELSGELLTSYFHCGTGTENDPFVITRPLHYYNLVNLYQRVPEYSDQHYYFQLGYQLKKGSEEFWVYDYDENGNIEKKEAEHKDEDGFPLTKVLNLETYNGRKDASGKEDAKHSALLPIGTHDKNFLGVFDGKGLTISGLTIASKNGEQGVLDIGVFGYVGPGVNSIKENDDVDEDNNTVPVYNEKERATIKDVYFENVTIDLTGATNVVSEVPEERTHNAEVHTLPGENNTTRNVSYVGYIAGHVVVGSSFENVFVNNVTISGGNASTSNFGYFGCIETADGSAVPTLTESVINEFGDEVGWGGSIDMKQIQTRLQQVWAKGNDNANPKTTTTPTTYQLYEIRTIDPTTNEVINIRKEQTSSSIYTPNPDLDNSIGAYRYYADDDAGSYYFYERDNYANHQFMALYGESVNNPKTLINITYYDESDNPLTGYVFSSGNKNLSILNGQLSASNQSIWLFEGNHLYSVFDSGKVDGKNVNDRNDGKKYYLTITGNTTSGYNLGVTTTAPSTTWRVVNGKLETTLNSETYYLEYSNAFNKWVVTTIADPCLIKDSEGHYLSANNNAQIISSNQEQAINWQLSANYLGNNTSFYTEINGKPYYLYLENGLLSLKNTSTPYVWQYDSQKQAYYGTFDVKNFYLTFDNGWTASNYFVIKSGENYLKVNGNNSFSNETSENATHFYFSSGSDTTAYGKVSCVVDGIVYYLKNFNGVLSTVTNINDATEWTNNEGSLFEAVDPNYALQYDNNEWSIKPLINRTVITDGKGNYLTILQNGNNYSISNQTNIKNATSFTIDGGRIYSTFGTTKVYLRNNSSSLTTYTQNNNNNRTIWTVGNDNISSVYNKKNYYIVYKNSSWSLSQTVIENIDTGLFRIQYDGNYAVVNDNSLDSTIKPENASEWELDGNRKIFTTIDNTKYYLTYSDSISTNSVLNITENSNSAKQWTKNGNVIRASETTSSGSWYNPTYYYYYLTFSNDKWSFVSDKSSSYNITNSASIFETATYYSNIREYNTNKPTVNVEQIEVEKFATLTKQNAQLLSILDEQQQRRIDRTEKKDLPGGYATFFPIRTNGDDEKVTGIWSLDNFKVSDKNTGYIISGARIAEKENTTDEKQKAAGDIRISYFPISNINGSYSTSLNQFNTLYTVNKDGTVTIDTSTDEKRKGLTPAFRTALNQLEKTLNGSSSVYGLHFMNAQISKDSLVIAPKAVIMGETYTNYQMPLDSINFHVKEAGSIRFFAGNYFTANSTFFSLHQIFRDEKNQIDSIKEIKEIYRYKTPNGKTPYMYKYYNANPKAGEPNESYSDPNFKGTAYLNEHFDLVFNMDWVTDPGFTAQSNKVYYYEIPCNAGEFALGSVSGKTGAYLIYLDIGANGSSRVSLEGNGLTQNKFLVDTRSPDFKFNLEKTNPEDHSLLQIAVDAPSVDDASKFSVTLSYNEEQKLYTIDIINKSEQNVNLTVFVCDDNNDQTDPYPYYYQINYINKDNTERTMQTADGIKKFQRCSTYEITNQGVSKPAWES